MYTVAGTATYRKAYKKLIEQDVLLKKRTIKTITQLAQDPFYPGLKTHKVQTKSHGEKFASRVTGDVRIIWDFSKDEIQLIYLYAIGRHSGKYRVYNK